MIGAETHDLTPRYEAIAGARRLSIAAISDQHFWPCHVLWQRGERLPHPSASIIACTYAPGVWCVCKYWRAIFPHLGVAPGIAEKGWYVTPARWCLLRPQHESRSILQCAYSGPFQRSRALRPNGERCAPSICRHTTHLGRMCKRYRCAGDAEAFRPSGIAHTWPEVWSEIAAMRQTSRPQLIASYLGSGRGGFRSDLLRSGHRLTASTIGIWRRSSTYEGRTLFGCRSKRRNGSSPRGCSRCDTRHQSNATRQRGSGRPVRVCPLDLIHHRRDPTCVRLYLGQCQRPMPLSLPMNQSPL